LISCRYTRYPGHPSNFVSSLSRKLLSLPESTPPSNSPLLDLCQIPAQSRKTWISHFRHKAHVRKGEEMPDPRSDSSFQKYVRDEDFVKLMKALGSK
jgi:hypothetical protein